MSTIKLPMEYVLGSQPLEQGEESLSLELLMIAQTIATKTFENQDFQSALSLESNLGNREKNKIIIELGIFCLFIITQWVNQNYKSDPKKLLDRMHFHFNFAFGGEENYSEFFELSNNRYIHYHNAFQKQDGAGPVYWVGKEATHYVLGKEKIEAAILIQSTMYLASLIPNVVGLTKKYIQESRFKDLFR